MTPIYLAIVEDDPIVKDGLSAFFNAQPTVSLGIMADSVEAFLEIITLASQKPEILLLDINLPGVSGIDGLPLIKKACPDTDVIMLTTFEETDTIFKALKNGACSYISKRVSLTKIDEAINIVYGGGSYMSPSIARKIAEYYMTKPKKKVQLTDRQLQIVDGIVAGKSYKMIATDLYVSLDTVRSHVKNIYKTLEINSKAELIRKSYQNDL